MRTEFKKITVEREVYIADDGTEFEDEYECEEHEFNLKCKHFTFYDAKFNVTDSLDCAFYVHLATKELVDEFAALNKWFGTTTKGLDEPGVYMYMDRLDGWENITNVIKKFKDIV